MRRSTPRQPAIRFVMAGRVRTLAGVDASTTVLCWLREIERRTGTKEGCAEGDCGACTVVLGELDGERIRYRPVNACILFMGVLDGKELIAVEDLQESNGDLHPAQRVLVEHHGSQCGFCTPGIVMSLFALYRSRAAPTPRLVEDSLAGNLCRCTGYRPIVEAGVRMCDAGRHDGFAAREGETVALLRSLRRRRMLRLDGPSCRWLAPATLRDLATVVRRQPDAVLLAGGTDVGRWVTKEHRDLPAIVYAGGVPELRRIDVTATHVEVGAAVALADAAGPIAAAYPDFGELLRRFGSTQIRSTATFGGNLATASPVGDVAPALIALGATIVLRRGRSTRELAVERFYRGRRGTALAPGELLERVRIPLPSPARCLRVYKVSKRFDQDISSLCAAFRFELADGVVRGVRLAFGGMAARPARARHAERVLAGRRWGPEAVTAAQAALERDFTPIDDVRASASYRLRVAKNLLWKLYLETTDATVRTRVVGDRA